MKRMSGGMSKTGKHILIGVLILILLAIIGVAVWYFLKKRNSYTKQEGKGCADRNELDPTPGGSIDKSVDECKQMCNNIDGCISFEHQPSINKCHFSSSCNADNMKDSTHGYDLYIKN